MEGRTVHLRAWRYDVKGVSGYTVPIYFLDADLPENSEWDCGLTQSLYGGDEHYRLSQEVILGIGGVRMLRSLGHEYIRSFHLNEGHAALLTLELLDEEAKRAGREAVARDDVEAVARYRQLAGTGHTTTDVKEAVSEAHHGRVEVLFVTVGVQVWGHLLISTIVA